MIEQKIKAKNIQEGDFLPGIDNGYVVEVEENQGYFSYPRSNYGASVAMPIDTVMIRFHDANGEECYLMLPGDSRITIKGEEREDEDDDY